VTVAAKAKSNPVAELAKLEEAAAAAGAEVQRIKARQQSAVDQINALRAERLSLQIEHPEMFTDGTPVLASKAAELTTSLQRLAQKLDNADFESAIRAAEVREDRAVEAATRCRGENARALLLALVEEDERASRHWAAWAAAGDEAIRRKLDIQHRASSICTQTAAYDPRDFFSLDSYAALVTQVSAAVEIHPALPRELLRELREQG
jgi:chromosome segregation ATPase